MTIQSVVFDFDGVILDSIAVRSEGFRQILAPYGEEPFERFLAYHHHNGGISRFVKFRYFFEEILGQPVSESAISEMTERFTAIMRDALTNPHYLIPATLASIQSLAQRYPLHIASGSEEQELRYLCKELGVAHYFRSIHGSPTPKSVLLSEILSTQGYAPLQVVMVGDSINDFEAAESNGMRFVGTHNDALRGVGDLYLPTLEGFDPALLLKEP